MPELPEVYSYQQYFNSNALNKKVKKVSVSDDKIINTTPSALGRRLKNQKFISTERVGKYLFAETDHNHWLVMHFGMTGYLNYTGQEEREAKAARVEFNLANEKVFSFINPRKFGRLDITDDMEKWIAEKKLGPDVLNISKDDFMKTLKGRKKKIKSALMDQKLFSGIGNIYSDEILYQTGVHPSTATHKLDKTKIVELYNNMRRIFKTALRHNGNPKELPQHYLIHHRKESTDCPDCNGKVASLEVGGRTSYYCPACQSN